MKTSEVLYEAADIIEKRGWARGTDGMLVGPGPKCLEGAVMAASSGPVWMDGRKYHYFDSAALVPDSTCPAGDAVREYLGRQDVFLWNDETGRTASEVIEVLRAAAVIEAAREEKDIAVEAAAVAVSA